MRWYEELDEKLRDYLPDLPVSAEEPLSKYTSFRIGGPARRMAFPRNAEQLVLLLNFAGECGARPYVLGNGTNVLFPDEGVDRLVISTRDMADIQLLVGGRVRAGAGASLARTAVFACQKGLAGLEFASGIPGSLGGAILMNAGAYGGEIGNLVRSVTVADGGGELRTLNREEMEFRYRHSAVMDSGDIILGATLELTRDDPDAIRERISELTRKRVSKQPLNFPSAGSTFKRPPGYFAAALIDQAGLRGYRVGDAQVSEKHTGFVVNRGHATASEILQLMDDVREKVHAMSGVWLEPEVRIIGEK